MKIAVIGAGAAGMMAAWGLKDAHDVTVYEKSPDIGGHVSSLTTDCYDTNLTVDNGFVVFNFENYPLLATLLKRFDIKPARAKMSVSISGGTAFSLCEDPLQIFLANKAWLFDPRVFLLLVNMIRFHAIAKRDLKNDNIPDITILEYVKKRRLSQRFYDNFLGPIAAAIWVGSPKSMANVPAHSFINFFEHHNMLGFRKFKWFTVKGGAVQYIKALAADLAKPPQTNCAIKSVTRSDKGVIVEDESGNSIAFDQVVFACQPGAALAMLSEPTPAEVENLSSFYFEKTTAYCHRDTGLMPKRQGLWMSWNCQYYKNRKTGEQDMSVSYYHNALQKTDRENQVFLSIAPPVAPRVDLTFKEYHWSHLQFDRASVAAQKKIMQMQGENHTWFAGAFLGYGFHEDALGSGLAVARALGCDHADLPNWTQPDW